MLKLSDKVQGIGAKSVRKEQDRLAFSIVVNREKVKLCEWLVSHIARAWDGQYTDLGSSGLSRRSIPCKIRSPSQPTTFSWDVLFVYYCQCREIALIEYAVRQYHTSESIPDMSSRSFRQLYGLADRICSVSLDIRKLDRQILGPLSGQIIVRRLT
jgi:hypothetical protein